ncbi:MAG: regulatory protein RecX [Pseudomonadales bacterium]|nr:regulatory protein RecX [Pseudomonadales bacterium]
MLEQATEDEVAPIDDEVLRGRAVTLLARREHSRRELVDKLRSRRDARGVDPERIEAVVAELADAGLQSDERCAEVLMHARIQRGHGPLRIRADLRDAGIPGELVDGLLEAEEGAWADRLRSVAERRFGTGAPHDARDWGRRARFLASRGFPEGLVRSLLGDIPF